MNLLIREATLNDAALLVQLTQTAWANKAPINSSGHHETEDKVTQDLRRGGAFILLINHHPEGSVRWLPLESQPHIWEIGRMGISPTFRGNNLSLHLIESIIHLALQSSVTELRLAVRPQQLRLIDLYATHGFEIAPELDYTQASHGFASVIMRKFL